MRRHSVIREGGGLLLADRRRRGTLRRGIAIACGRFGAIILPDLDKQKHAETQDYYKRNGLQRHGDYPLFAAAKPPAILSIYHSTVTKRKHADRDDSALRP
jgi:hypothetical protein